MKTAHSWLKSILCFSTFVLLVSCASYIPTDSTVGSMSVQQARNVVTTELKRYGYTFVRFTSKKMVAGGLVYMGHTYDPKQITYSEITQIYQRGAAPEQILIKGQDKQLGFFYITSNPRDFTSALYVLKQNAIKQQKDAAENDARFVTSLADHRNKITSNATLPEEANKYKAQAEGAVRDKEFNDAADYYAAALKIAPWWPVGHFNRALVLGEAGDYEMARREMDYYLQLVPDAPNARAAQDKIYQWERKAGEGN